jgi:tetratricopeptide (TPR) repeat protein
LYVAARNLIGQANVIKALGHLEAQAGDSESARARYAEARAVYRELNARMGEANVLLALGELELTEGQLEPARSVLRRALSAYQELRHPVGQGQACFALAQVSQREKPRGSRNAEMRDWLEQAEERFRVAGADDLAAEVRQRITVLREA